MRLRLIALLLPALAWAGGGAGARVDVFDDGWITVVMPSVEATVDEPGWRAGLRASVDAVSGATPILVVDAVSSATAVSERRGAMDLSLAARPRAGQELGASLSVSRESDDRTIAGGLEASRELVDRRLGLSARYTASDRRTAQHAGAPRTERSLGHAVDLGATWIASRDLTLGARVSAWGQWCEERLGCAPSAYRYVGLAGGSGFIALPERHPETRHALAASVRASLAVGDAVGLHAAVRAYADTWSIRGLTGSAGAAWEGADDRLLLGLGARATVQTAAGFSQPAYAMQDGLLPAWRTADRELGGLSDLGLTGRAAWTWHGVGPLLGLTVSARVSRVWFTYADRPSEAGRAAWIAGGGLRVER